MLQDDEFSSNEFSHILKPALYTSSDLVVFSENEVNITPNVMKYSQKSDGTVS